MDVSGKIIINTFPSIIDCVDMSFVNRVYVTTYMQSYEMELATWLFEIL